MIVMAKASSQFTLLVTPDRLSANSRMGNAMLLEPWPTAVARSDVLSGLHGKKMWCEGPQISSMSLMDILIGPWTIPSNFNLRRTGRMDKQRLCKLCGKNPAAFPDREKPGPPIAELCRECYFAKVKADILGIIRNEVNKPRTPRSPVRD
jgi:hypothetical protein